MFKATFMNDILSLYHFIPFSQRRLFPGHTKQYKKGDFLLLDGDIQHELYLIKQGVVILCWDQDDVFKVVDFAYEHRFCVDIGSFSSQTPSSYCIQCLDDCDVEFIHYDDLERLFDAAPDVERAYRILLERILAALLKKSLTQEVMTIQQKFDWIIGTRPELFRLVPHKYIASYLNIDPTNFSKLFTQECKRGKLFYE